MPADTIKLLSEATLSFTLVIALIYFARMHFKGAQKDQDNQARQEETARLTATSNLLLAQALDKFAESAALNVIAMDKQKDATQVNLQQLKLEDEKINALMVRADDHTVGSRTRDAATVVRDANAATAVAELPERIRVVMRPELDALEIAITLELNKFLSLLKVDSNGDAEVPQKIEISLNPEVKIEAMDSPAAERPSDPAVAGTEPKEEPS